MYEEVLKLLDLYYDDNRSKAHKEEITNLIEDNADILYGILKKYRETMKLTQSNGNKTDIIILSIFGGGYSLYLFIMYIINQLY